MNGDSSNSFLIPRQMGGEERKQDSFFDELDNIDKLTKFDDFKDWE